MSVFEHVLIILLLISVSAFFSMSEIALAASRKLRLRQLLSDGELRAKQVLMLQEHPANFFTIVQIGLNAVAILGGILGEAAFTPTFVELIQFFYDGPALQSLGFGLSVFFVTALFILFADLMPKRLATAMTSRSETSCVSCAATVLRLSAKASPTVTGPMKRPE